MADDSRRLRVLVVDDHEVVHWGFRLMLGQQPWVERCLSARSADEALTLAGRYMPHVALVDLFIGEETGAEVSKRLLEAMPGLRVLLISGAGRISAAAARAAGASGFIAKDRPAAEIATAVRVIATGREVFPVEESPSGTPLTDRERDVLELGDGALVLEVVNDGVSGRPRQTGMGLRLAALEALQVGGIVEFGEREPGTWRVRLAVPVDRA